MKRIPEFIAEEAEWAEVPSGEPVVRSIRWALLHGELFTARQVAERFDVSTSTLSVVARDLRDAGYVLEEVRVAKQKSFRVVGKGEAPSTEPKPKAKRGRPRRTEGPVVPEPHRHTAPWLGSAVRVVMLAEDGDRTALVLLDEYGTRWPVVMDGGPL